mgnify:FL=1
MNIKEFENKMTRNNLNDFVDDLYHNPEKEIRYQGTRYMVSGYTDKNCKLYTLEVYTVERECKTIFTHTSKERSKCVKAFENAKIFAGKTFYEAEKGIEVIYG